MHTLVPALLFLALCSGCRSLDGEGVVSLPGPDPEHPRLRYLDGQVSANDSCLIRLTNALNPRIPPAYVNGRPLGFC